MSMQRNYVGRAGQLAFIAELLYRGCNVAVPEVDRGLDLLAFLDEGEEITRVQIKTGDAEKYKRGDGPSVQFNVPLKQLNEPDLLPLFYGLVVRLGAQWVDYFIISRAELASYAKTAERFGTATDENLVLTFQCREQVICGSVDLTVFRNAWGRLPPLQTVAGTPLAGEG